MKCKNCSNALEIPESYFNSEENHRNVGFVKMHQNLKFPEITIECSQCGSAVYRPAISRQRFYVMMLISSLTTIAVSQILLFLLSTTHFYSQIVPESMSYFIPSAFLFTILLRPIMSIIVKNFFWFKPI